MLHETTVLRTKLSPPRPRAHALIRPRVDALLRDALDHRVTIVQASAGYGKSTALAQMAAGFRPLFWYSASDGDRDARQFLAHLAAACRQSLPDLPDTPPHEASAAEAVDRLLNALDATLTTPSLLVIDDYHLAESGEVSALVDRFLAFLPRDLHTIIATRYPPSWPGLVAWRAKGEVLEIRRDHLAFTPPEVLALFHDKYGLTVMREDVEALCERTEGWPIALQLVWQGMRGRPQASIQATLGRGSQSLETLFAYLVQSVLAQQPSELRDFLLETSALRELDVAACSAVAGHNCTKLLAQVRERDLLVVELGEGHCRYHHLFRDFLYEQAQREDAAGVRQRHSCAGEFYLRARDADEAIHHLLSAGDFAAAAAAMEAIGERVLREGRLDTLATWLDALPAALVAAHPLLMFYLGDLARLHSRFEAALAWYDQAGRAWRLANDVAGVARALRGQALVHLDTVRPSQAESLLQEALRLTDGLDDRRAQARMLELLAENKLNMGKTQEAQGLRDQARALREEGPSEDTLSVRVKLRTGCLDEARAVLESWVGAERRQAHPPRAHRETWLILSLIYSMLGHAEEALGAAREALALAEQFDSPLTMAAGKLRLGHALQVSGEPGQAMHCYEEAIALGDRIAVPRARAEARMGMARLHGLGGDLGAARCAAEEGMGIARSAGDAWMVALLQATLGAGLVAGGDAQGAAVLEDALAAFGACGDAFGRTLAHMWLAVAHWHGGERGRALTHTLEALDLGRARRYDDVFTRRTLFGWQDARVFVPLLVAARRGQQSAYATQLLAALGLADVTIHPGYQLRVQTLGPFRVWLGAAEASAGWRRRKARELLQLFITCRGHLLEREQILESLWAGDASPAALRDLKVALYALNRVIEPERVADGEPSFVCRAGSAYGLRPGADLWIDADEFAGLIAQADASAGDDALALYHQALALYHDDYLAVDARYADWATAERERLLTLYLQATSRLAQGLLAAGRSEECIACCERILARDRAWEAAYRLLMRAYAARGDRALARRSFEQCTRALRECLDVEPSPATVQAWQEAGLSQP